MGLEFKGKGFDRFLTSFGMTGFFMFVGRAGAASPRLPFPQNTILTCHSERNEVE